ncbi:MAG: UTRA domain-containing protein, partial [Leptolyngbyaceae cyanobacterium SL_7_1]|nr:UTRA domain-containing protein [Leptolyngbyaceae cyanobacterium SL_7_1]
GSHAIHNLTYELVTANETIQQNLRLPPDKAAVYFQQKLLSINELPVAVDSTHILAELGETYAEVLQHQMTFPILEEHGVAIERIEATIECTRANHEMSSYLAVPLGDPLLVYCYTAYTRDEQPIVCGETFSPGDRLGYSVVLTT